MPLFFVLSAYKRRKASVSNLLLVYYLIALTTKKPATPAPIRPRTIKAIPSGLLFVGSGLEVPDCLLHVTA